MFPISKVLLTFAFLVTVINSTPHPDTEIFDLNPDVAPSMDMFPDEISYDDDLIPIGDQDYLFAGNPGTSESCSAEGWQPFSAIGRLRQRRGSPAGSEGGNSCISPSEGGNSGAASDESLNTDLLRLPIVEDLVVPAYEGRPDICPPLVFEDRDIPLCSTDNLITQLSFNGRNTVLPNAKVYNPFYGCLPHEKLWCCNAISFSMPNENVAEITGWGVTGYDCMENDLFGSPVPR